MQVVAVFLGGVIGTALRFGIDAAIPHTDSTFPTSTLIANVIGSFALGLLVSRAWPTVSPVTKALLGPGVLGSFTTFSAVAVSLVALTDGGRLPLALAYLAVTLLGGFVAAVVGLRLGRRTPIDASHE